MNICSSVIRKVASSESLCVQLWIIPFISKYRQSNSGMRFSAISWEIAGYLSLIHLKNLGTPIVRLAQWACVCKIYCYGIGCGVRARAITAVALLVNIVGYSSYLQKERGFPLVCLLALFLLPSRYVVVDLVKELLFCVLKPSLLQMRQYDQLWVPNED